MEDMSSVFHKSDVLGGRVYALAVLYWSLKHVGELGLVSEIIGTDKVNHAPVLYKIVLQRISCQNDTSSCADLL